MKTLKHRCISAVITAAALTATGNGAEKKPPEATAWFLVLSESAEIRPKPEEGKKGSYRAGRGALMPSFEVKQSHGKSWTRVRAVNPAKLVPEFGWAESALGTSVPIEQYPKDTDLLTTLGGAYLDDFTAANTAIARFVVRRGADEPALVCFLGSPIMSSSRLQVFSRIQGKMTPGPHIELPFSEIQSGITKLEVRDLVGDGNECILTHEPFTQGPENSGLLMVIRRFERDELKVLWKGPLEWRNLANYPPKIGPRQPPEVNIGTPGTVTKGEVEFRARGRQTDIFWKGKVEFRAIGREAPVETLNIEKTITWDGTKFTLLP